MKITGKFIHANSLYERLFELPVFISDLQTIIIA